MNSKSIKIVTIGGGSSYTPELAEGLIKRMLNHEIKIKEWWLVDVNEDDGPQKLNIIFDLVTRMFAKAKLKTVIKKTLNHQEALKNGVDFVTTQLRVGRLEARIKDERIPLEHHFIGQETNGAGGLFKALRTIPVILNIVADVKKLAPKAWIINFTNPAGIITQAVAKYGNYEKFIGVCNVPINLRIGVANYLNTTYDHIKYNVAGLNHFVYFSRFWKDKTEVTAQILQAACDPIEFQKLQPANVQATTFDPNLIQNLKALPCGYHRYYYNKGKVLNEYLTQLTEQNTRAEAVIALEKELFVKYQNPMLAEKPPELALRGGAYYSEVACSVLTAIHNDTGQELVVSTVNHDHVSNFPNDLVVETTARISKKGPLPVLDRKVEIPIHALALVMLMKDFELLTAKAAVKKDSHLGLMALQINPLCEDSHEAKLVFNQLLKAHQKYLPGFKILK